MQKQNQKPAKPATDKAAKLADAKARNAKAQAAKAKAAKTAAERDAAKAAFRETVKADRATAIAGHRTFDPARVSVPVKSFAAFRKSYQRDPGAHPIGRKPSARQAAALTYACLASGKPVSDGATFPRKFTHAGRSLAVENGATRDILASGLATYDPKTESFKIASGATAEITGLIGSFAKLA